MTYLDELNPRQREAAEHTDGPLLIVAGAGAGKTKTLTHRVLNLIMKGTAPEEILAITFTNKAAKEMYERVSTLLRERLPAASGAAQADSGEAIGRHTPGRSAPGSPFIGTFHALGAYILREQSQAAGLSRHFSIYDRDDSKTLIRQALKDRGLDPKQYDPAKVLGFISRKKGESVTVREFLESDARGYFEKIVADVWPLYEAALKKESALDFDDLLLHTVELLKNNKRVLEEYRTRWRYVHVDEYQDTNVVQYNMTRLLAAAHQNICVVGDADQTIYTWRGADLSNILNFEKDYPNAKVVLLEENYRSTQRILSAANDIIKKNTLRKEKTLFTKNETGERIFLHGSFTESDEAQFIVSRARELIQKGVSPREIAVLYRANFQSRVLEQAFLNAGVPHQVLGVRFFDRKEIKDVLSYIRAALNPESFSDVKRTVNAPPRGIGQTTLLKIFSGKEHELQARFREKLAAFRVVLKKIQGAATTKLPSEVVKFVIKESGLEKHLKDGSDDDRERLENMQELVTLALSYDGLPQGGGIEKLLEDAALATDQDSLIKNQNAVKLMTVHAAKGLEFDHVFVTGLEEELFPHRGDGDTAEKAEEERRLFYVALTRARTRVHLSYAAVRTIFGSQRVNIPSEFITDLNEDDVEASEQLRPGEHREKTIYLE